ncbi:SAM-dependent methyltransferase [Amycolatopsis rubida]|uniref:S-adenosyl-L-methionine-dependent methyltransferase n=1 Tax=Amycolatopsis rubida TaxID=112413 RepID=A0A1I5F9D6_9PSEU|nr:SAM-dependent methyltransferase [Amycolatopsis rubida]SFO20352.1 methyltransferase, TIGR00027 family [Amycolatopsis rubida]
MAAPEQDWDIVSSVGLTALGVAAGRAIATVSPDPLIEDRFAAEFVRAANPPRPMPVEPVDDPLWTAMAEYLAVRSRFFDEVVTGTDAPQVVILAAGLDARAFRLDLSGRDVFEVDQPRVLEFKQDVLEGLGAAPRCRRHPIGADLREDWPAALENAGFDRTRPSVWIAEGLLPYLPARAEELLFDLVHARCVAGSRIRIEHMPDLGGAELRDALQAADAEQRFGLDMNDLVSTEPRRNPVDWLAGQGWKTTVNRSGELAARYGKQLSDPFGDLMTKTELVSADLP